MEMTPGGEPTANITTPAVEDTPGTSMGEEEDWILPPSLGVAQNIVDLSGLGFGTY